jgi:AraC-like DNA-binding protein
MSRSQNIQLMRPALLAPFLGQLDLRGLDTSELLARMGLTRGAIRDNTGMVTAKQVHNFLRTVTEASGDPFFCWITGLNTNPRKYLMYANLVSRDTTLGETLTKLSLSAAGLSSATRLELLIDGASAQFSGQRLYRSEPAPHTDAFMLGTLVALVGYYLGKHLTVSQLSLSAHNTGLIPNDLGRQLTATSAIRDTVTIQFPTSWLLVKPGQKPHEIQPGDEQPPGADLIEFLASALAEHLHNPELTAESAAILCDSKLREINQALKPQGVSLADLISTWRADKACSLLRKSDESVAGIGAAVGYPDATSFSRAFRHWTGLSPRQYRKSDS